MTIKDYNNRAWYALRRTLPPWSWEENLKELVECCPEYGIDEVIVKVDTEEFSHHIPTIEWLVNYQRVLFNIKAELEKIKVVFSINPWVTLVHGDRGRNCKALFPEINFMVGHDGVGCIDCACPLSKGWRDHTAALWKIYAQTHPAVIWVEDDIRTFWHYPVEWGCFCDEHLKRFSARIGKKVDRENLVKRILQPGNPHPYRKKWLDMQGEIMVAVAGVLERAVHAVSPETNIGLMSSGPAFHCAEGRKWHAFSKAFAGTNAVVSRPPLSNYSEGHLKGLYYSADSIRRTRYVLPKKTIELAEVENCPFTQYSKSTTFTFLQSALCFSMGAHGVTLNLFDHCGTPMKENIEILDALKDAKDYLKAIAGRCSAEGVFSGVRIFHHDSASIHKQVTTGAKYSDLVADSYGWEDALQALGFATTYESSHIVALTGQTVRCLGKKEIFSMLSQGLLCDLSAAETLQDMGYDEYLGVNVRRVFRRDSEALAGEHFFHADFGGAARKYFALAVYRNETLAGELELRPGAVEVSEMVNPDAKRLHPCLTLFENSLKGRIGVYPFNMNQIGFEFLRPMRQIQMMNILNWMSRGRLPFFVQGGHNTLPFRMDYGTRSIVGVFCLSLDSWKGIEGTLYSQHKTAKRIEVLADNGKWRPFEHFIQTRGCLCVKYDGAISYQKPVILSIEWKNDEG